MYRLARIDSSITLPELTYTPGESMLRLTERPVRSHAAIRDQAVFHLRAAQKFGWGRSSVRV
jgi:hypothetical protein